VVFLALITIVISWGHTVCETEEHKSLCRPSLLRGPVWFNTVCCARFGLRTEAGVGLPLRDRDEIVLFDPS
jgi:hypothetical protein